MKKWSHPGGKLRELGAEALSDAELPAILISTVIRAKPAEKIAQEAERASQVVGYDHWRDHRAYFRHRAQQGDRDRSLLDGIRVVCDCLVRYRAWAWRRRGSGLE
jgi:hypothetical protein